MIMLPNAALDRLRGTVTGESVRLTVTGEVLAYRGRNYLLLTAFQVRPSVTPAAQAGSAEAAAAAADGADGVSGEGAGVGAAGGQGASDIDDIAADLDRLRATPGGLSRSVEENDDAATGAGDASPTAPLPEGTPIVGRAGRLERSAAGAWSFVSDNDPDTPGTERAMIVLPCRLLEQMEARAGVGVERVRMRVSGRVVAFDGENYLLPTLLQFERGERIKPLQ